MNKRLWCLVAVLGASLVFTLSAATNSTPTTAPVTATPSSKEQSAPGVEVAQALSTVTGVAISPLLGVGAVGAWKYLKTPAERRGRLPWFAQPWFWIPALLVVGLVFAKDAMGPAIPTTLKKPFDLLEMFESKLSALVVAGAFVPLIAAVFGSTGGEEALARNLGLAMADPAAWLNLIAVPAAVAVFLVVWMASHVVNVLILISPFAMVDTGLKSARLFLLGTVAMSGFANPYVGAAWSIIIILVAYLVAGWSFRLTVFGMVFGWDILTLRQRYCSPRAASNCAFTARKLEEVPVRTFGKLVREESGELVFKYRPLLVLRQRVLKLPENRYVLGRGLIHPEVLQVERETGRTMFTMPPRYRGKEADLAQVYGFDGVQEVGVLKGAKAVWRWVKELIGFGTVPLSAPPAAS